MEVADIEGRFELYGAGLVANSELGRCLPRHCLPLTTLLLNKHKIANRYIDGSANKVAT